MQIEIKWCTELLECNCAVKVNAKQLEKKCHLTPFGKVTVQTFIIFKLNHLFITLPNSSPAMLISISDIMYKFIWNDRPDKVNRQQICMDYVDGGHKMLDLKN